RPAAGRDRGGYRRGAGRDRGGRPPVPRPVPRRHGAGGGRAVLPVLGQPPAHARNGRPGPRLGVRMHTHLAETREEDAYCRRALGRTPAEYAEDLGWVGPDVWLAHCVYLDE